MHCNKGERDYLYLIDSFEVHFNIPLRLLNTPRIYLDISTPSIANVTLCIYLFISTFFTGILSGFSRF